MDKLAKVFQFNGAQVNVVEKDGRLLFRAKDVCSILEIANPRDAIMRLDEDERDVVITDTPPAYTEFIGRQLMEYLQRREAIA